VHAVSGRGFGVAKIALDNHSIAGDIVAKSTRGSFAIMYNNGPAGSSLIEISGRLG
jgi:hypothetical protein